MSKFEIYISSTFKDLAEYRNVIISNVHGPYSASCELNRIMEYMVDDGDSQPFAEECVEEINKSDVYFLILNNRVGSSPPNSEKTYTQLEYEAAMSNKNIRIFRFVNKKFIEAECDNIDRYKKFRAQFSGIAVNEFTDVESFENKFLKCMGLLLQQRNPPDSSRNFYYILSGIILLIAIAAASLVYKFMDEKSRFESAALVFLMFSIIILVILKNIWYPTRMSTLK